MHYPPALVNVIVVADNCTDATVSIARAIDGVLVLERCAPDHPGKPSALNWAIEQTQPEVEASDAVIVMDADTRMDGDFLCAMDAAFHRAGGRPFAAQGRYDVLNPDDGWRTALMAGALSLVHVVRPLARELMGLSVGLKGNGMCFSRGLLAELPWNPSSLTEDIELGIDLIEKKGMRIEFVSGAVVSAQMPVTQAAAAGQRRRWEGGRGRIVRDRAVGLLLMGIIKRNRIAIDAAIDLLLPPVAELFAILALWGAVIGLGVASHALPISLSGLWWVGCGTFVVLLRRRRVRCGGRSQRGLFRTGEGTVLCCLEAGHRYRKAKSKRRGGRHAGMGAHRASADRAYAG